MISSVWANRPMSARRERARRRVPFGDFLETTMESAYDTQAASEDFAAVRARKVEVVAATGRWASGLALSADVPEHYWV